jgi:5'-3' exonuclease
MKSLFGPRVIDENKVLLLDTSFVVFNRYLAGVSYGKKCGTYVEPERAAGDPCPPASEAELIAFGDGFRQTLTKLMRAYNVAGKNVVFMIDCSRSAIWRMDLLPTYKGTRTSPRDFPSNVFSHFYEVVIRDLQETMGVKSISCPRAEADDIAYVLCNHYSRLGRKVICVSADSDYSQLVGPNVSVHDLKGNCILEKACKKAGTDAGDPQAYLLAKCIQGDISDCITSIRPKVGPKTALKLARDPELLAKELENPETRAKYELNRRLIDLSCMPDDIKAGIEEAIARMDA